MRTILYIILVMLCVCNSHPLPAQSDKPLTADEDARQLSFSLDVAQYRQDKDNKFVEVYYSFYQDQFTATILDSKEATVFKIEAGLYQNDSLMTNRIWSGMSFVSKIEDAVQKQEMLTLTQFVLPPGDYQLITNVEDMNSDLEGTKTVDFTVESLSDSMPAMSDIQISHSMTPDTSTGIYTKNGYKMLPNPRALYGLEKPMLYFYFEIYNLADSAYYVEYSILDKEGNPNRIYPPQKRITTDLSSVEVGGINVVALPTGAYFLKLQVTMAESNRKISRRKKFYVYRDFQKQLSANTDPIVRYYLSLSEKQIDEEFQSTIYISTVEERDVYKDLALKGKRAFMIQFWKRRDPIPETVENDLRETYLQRVEMANEKFTAATPGWKTDRGRVLILYGEPDEVEQDFGLGMEETARTETWQYYTLQSGVIFIFVETNWNEFELVHSTARNERHDLGWQERLVR